MPKIKWENHFATLNEKDRKDPFRVIGFVCEDSTLFSVRSKLFELFIAAMSSNDLSGDAPTEKENWLWLFRGTINLYESAYLIDELRKEDRLIYTIH